MRTVYSLDYHREYPWEDVIRLRYPTSPINAGIELDGRTLRDLIEFDLIKDPKEEVWKRIQQRYGLQDFPEDYWGASVGYLQYEETDKEGTEELADFLKKYAIEVLTNASGDDDFYDYAPGLADLMQGFLRQVGFQDYADEIEQFLRKNGHYD